MSCWPQVVAPLVEAACRLPGTGKGAHAGGLIFEAANSTGLLTTQGTFA